ncbi:MAG: acyl-CoA dehydrogenase family protein [Gammaproteobacteria bacterium]|jgi:putative acyl-CoA dehydrogenase
MTSLLPLEPYNPFERDSVLRRAVDREGAGSSEADLLAFGVRVGSEEVFQWGFDANRYGPELITHSPFGERIDEVRYHPSYHRLIELSVGAGIHASHYDGNPGDGSYVARTARMHLISQVEVGHGCPISMTGAVLPALREQPELAAIWEPRIRTRSYDSRLINPAAKTGNLLGMGLTEKQGGSDVRANLSVAVPVNGGGPAGEYRLSGHKWFTSAPMCDAFLLLAQAPAGISCFLVPRVLPDGERNSLRLMRLKNKLGNRSNASAELEFVDASGWLVGEEGRGINVIIKMVNATRIDVTNWSVSLMRQAVSQASWYLSQREAFGARLIDKPLMQNVLADLELETEVGTMMVMRLAGAFERAPTDDFEASFLRLSSAVAKYWLTKRSSPVVREALECIGGNGYVEDSILPRLYREAPLNAIWEGAGNVIALDVIRALQRSPEAGDAFVNELELARGTDGTFDQALDRLKEALSMSDPSSWDESEARRLVEQLAVCWGASLCLRHEPVIAGAYIRSRLERDWGAELGTLPRGLNLAEIARRACPEGNGG